VHIAPSAPEYLAALKYEMLSEVASANSTVKVSDAEAGAENIERNKPIAAILAIVFFIISSFVFFELFAVTAFLSLGFGDFHLDNLL
jgi:hypothetical protein